MVSPVEYDILYSENLTFQEEKEYYNKIYDLEKRTQHFAREVRKFIRTIKRHSLNIDDIRQLIRSSGSVGANYIEANESLSENEYLFRVKVCRKEVKESIYWLTLLEIDLSDKEKKQTQIFRDEAAELMKIFGAIIIKVEKSLNKKN